MKRPHLARACAVLVLGLLTPCVLARAEPPARSGILPEVSQEARRAAEALFAEGSTLFLQWQFAAAEQKYREALALWKHPVITLYLGRALEKQGKLESAYEMVLQARREGAELLSAEDARVAAELQTNLESRLAEIEVDCDEADAETLLDGEPWFIAPGRWRQMVRPGQHVIMARKEGYHPVTKVVSVFPGKRTMVQIRMRQSENVVGRPWQRTKPLMLTGVGALTVVFGWHLLDTARVEQEATGRSSGEWTELLATSIVIAGGAVVVAGLMGLTNDPPRPARSQSGDEVEIDVIPLISGDAGGISARLRF